MKAALKSIAVLKANLDDGKDYIEAFVPFIATLIAQKKYQVIDVETICKDMKDQYGLTIPHHPLQTILGRCSKRGFLRKSDHQWYPDWRRIGAIDFSAHSQEKVCQLDALVADLGRFAEENDLIEALSGTAEEALWSYLSAFDAEVIMSRSFRQFIPKIKRSRRQLFVVNAWIKDAFENRPDAYSSLSEIAAGYLYATTVFYYRPETYSGKLGNLAG